MILLAFKSGLGVGLDLVPGPLATPAAIVALGMHGHRIGGEGFVFYTEGSSDAKSGCTVWLSIVICTAVEDLGIVIDIWRSLM